MLLDVAHMISLVPSDLRFITTTWSPRLSWPGCPAFSFAMWRTRRRLIAGRRDKVQKIREDEEYVQFVAMLNTMLEHY